MPARTPQEVPSVNHWRSLLASLELTPSQQADLLTAYQVRGPFCVSCLLTVIWCVVYATGNLSVCLHICVVCCCVREQNPITARR